MTFSLLFDLDDTLLDTNLDVFLQGYFKKFAGFMSTRIQPGKFVSSLLSSTKTMYNSRQIDLTLEDAFSRDFYPLVGFDQGELAPQIEKFYAEVFPSLAPLTSPRPEAVELVKWAFSQGWNVAIATDPLFPRTAILQRLAWAGLPVEKYPFTLISDFQTFHFAKASVAYFPEFLARMGWVDGPVLMVGDSLERDIIPSQKAGVPVFWLKSPGDEAYDGIPHGSLGDLRRYLEHTDLSTLKVNYNSPSSSLAFLQATAAIFHTFTKTLAPEQWERQPAPGEWSILEILCHLRDVDAEVNLIRIDTILKEDNPVITGQITDQWALERGYNSQGPLQSFNTFVNTRVKMIKMLESLTPDDWNRRARHTILGPTTLAELVIFMVEHDQLHIQQAMSIH